MTADDATRQHESTDESDSRDATGSSTPTDGRHRDSTHALGRRTLLKAVGTAAIAGVTGIGTTAEPAAAAEPDAGRWVARHGMSAAEYQDEFDDHVEAGLRLTHVAGYGVGDEARYAAIWEEQPGPAWVTHHGMTPGGYQRRFDEYADEGYRLATVSGYAVGGESRYAAIWERRDGPAWVAHHGMSGDDYQRRFDDYVDRGYRLTHVSGHGVGGEARYAAIWERRDGPAWVARHGMTAAEYQDEYDGSGLAAEGFRPVDVSGFSVGGESRYAAIWERRDDTRWEARHGLTPTAYQEAFDELRYQGYRLADVSGHAVPPDTFWESPVRHAGVWEADGLAGHDLDALDSRITGYTNQYGIPGLSVAISRDERLVFAKGYGQADRSTGEELRPSHRFRIASISKPITSVAIMRLVESGQLGLDRAVFGSNGVLGTRYGTPTYGSSITSSNPGPVTVRHLLEHASGWSFARNNDPMFKHPGKTQDELISHVLANRPIQSEPGTSFSYLNFGYCLLGRVIEAVTDRSYEGYVRDAVLSNCGIDGMAIAGNSKAARKSDEVVYHGSNAYGPDVARMDAHGGWIATPIDLLRFLVRVDGFGGKADVLAPSSERELFEGERPRRRYGKGWMLRSNWRGHNGSLPGSIGFLVRRDDGTSFAALANSRPSNARRARRAIRQLRTTLDAAIDDVDDWPDYDLF